MAALAAFLLFGCGYAAQGEDSVEKGREKVRAYVAGQHVPGLSVAVSRKGRILWSEGFGLADLEHRVAVWPRTKFRVGSISKALTSVAVARLWQEGKLDLDAPVQKYAPSFPQKKYPITTRHLAGHLSGLPHYNAADIVNTVHYSSVTDALRKFQDRELLFQPGERFSYSSFGWNLISVVVEGASGQEFLTYMQEQVFQPLGMRHTVADHYDRIIEHRTEFHQVDASGKAVNAVAVDNSDVWAAGGFLSTAEDLVRFGNGVVSGKLLAPQSLELLFTPMKANSGESTGYGLGWRSAEIDGIRTVGHGGSHVGATARLLAVPDQELVVAILTNSNNSGLAGLALEIAGLFLQH